MNILLFALTLLATASGLHGHYKKCCKLTEILIEVNNTYACVESEFKRLGVITNETDFMRTKSDGICVDFSNGISIFNVSGGRIVRRQPIAQNYFPKCCPMGYTYSSVLHACEETGNYTDDYIKETFIRIGLPKCKLIVDYELNNGPEPYRSLQLLEDAFRYEETYCVDKNEKGSFVLRVCKENNSICDHVRCIKKCCPDGQSFINKSRCYDTYVHGIDLSSFSMVDKPEEPFAVISNRSCEIYMLTKKYHFHLDEKGVFNIWSNKSGKYLTQNATNTDSYCIEHAKIRNVDGYYFFMCVEEKKILKKFEYTLWPKILSCICLILTILVYLGMLNEARNVFGMVLVTYCLALFFQNGVLLYSQWNVYPSKRGCQLRGFFIIFLTIASFTWSNVVCYDIWRTFGSTRKTFGTYRKKVVKKLLPYFIYGWGIPAIVTLMVYIFYTYEILPYAIQPFLGRVKCFFEDRKGNYARAFFLGLPEAIMQLVNTVFFLKTAIYCRKVKKEINKIDDTTRDDKIKKLHKDRESLFLILKLSVIMGISFTFEVITVFLDMKNMGEVPKCIEIVWDIINCLQGVFIFIIFICKRKVLCEVLKKFKLIVPRKRSSASLYTQSTTASSGQANRNAGLENEQRKYAISR